MSSCRVSSSRILSKLPISVLALLLGILLLLCEFKRLNELREDVAMVSLLSRFGSRLAAPQRRAAV